MKIRNSLSNITVNISLHKTNYDEARKIFDSSIDSRDIEVADDLEAHHSELDSTFDTGAQHKTKTSGESNSENKRLKYSFVWQYFRAIPNSKQYHCVLCQSCVGNQTSNLARHLATSHDISRQKEKGFENLVGIRPRSFIWKYCTKEDSKHARCHLCNKVLYFGGGNTGNISKHLRRLHEDLIKELSKESCLNSSSMDDETMQAAASLNQSVYEEENGRASADFGTERKERRGASYVWNYCEKLSRHTIRCKLCTKVMSFHGTANVITHLQRRHNVLGESGTPLNQIANGKSDFNEENNDIDNPDPDEEHIEFPSRKMGRKSYSSASVVWKYCKRVTKDQVRCCFCKKNLSYQGTSNLQRHLHRMHGVVTHGRVSKHGAEEFESIKDNKFQLPENIDFIWQFCTQIGGDQGTKCNMCDALFETKDTEAIVRHLTVIHSVETNQPAEGGDRNARARKRTRAQDLETSDDGNYEEFYESGKWSKLDDTQAQHLQQEFDEGNIKRDESLYDDIIVEDYTNCDEEPFDPGDVPQVNPLSPHSSHGDSSQHVMDNNYQQQFAPQPTSATLNYLPALDVKVLQKLQEDRLRMETEYFREKAGFYRMQKYLTALQAKKVRTEIDRMHQEEATVVATADLNGAYAVEVAIPEHHITTQ